MQSSRDYLHATALVTMEKVESFMAEVRRYVVARKTEIYEL